MDQMITQKTKEIIQKEQQLLSLTTRVPYYPLVVEEARGVIIKDIEGNEFIDFLASAAVINTGHNHPRVVNAIKGQVDKFIHYTPAYMYHKPHTALAEKIKKSDAVVGVEELPWALPKESCIVIDDLDPGFQALEGEQSSGLRIAARKNNDEETDQGLPTRPFAYGIPSSWSRISLPMFYGRYRHTMVAVKAGKGEKKAMFTSDIPRAGQWDLEVYIPAKLMVYPGRKWGTWKFTIRDKNGDEREIEFDSNSAYEGWNIADSFDLPEGETSVALSNETDGKFVIADAIRWSPAAGS